VSRLPLTSALFSMKNGMDSINILVKHLNALIKGRQIHAWYPGRWVEWRYSEIEISFYSLADAQRVGLGRVKW